MKKLPLVLSVVAILAAIAMFVTMLIGHKDINKTTSSSNVSDTVNSGIRIAYIQTDSLMMNYELALDLQEDFFSKQQQYQVEVGTKQNKLQQDAAAFQEKVQRGGFLTEERAVRERDRIMAQEQEMQKLGNELTNKLAQLEAEMNRRIADSIMNFVEAYNEEHKYTYILSNTGNILVGNKQYDITKEILDGLNADYLAGK